MEHRDIVNALLHKYPGAQWVLREEPFEFEWHETSIPKPTESDIKKAFEEYTVHRKSTEYLRLREAEYPSESEKSKALWELHSNDNPKLLDEIKNRIKAIDAKYPQ